MKLPSVSHSLDFTTFISGWVKTSPLVDVVTLGCSISTALVSCFPAKNLKVKNPAAKERSHFHNQQEVLSPQEIKPSVIFLWGIFFFLVDHIAFNKKTVQTHYKPKPKYTPRKANATGMMTCDLLDFGMQQGGGLQHFAFIADRLWTIKPGSPEGRFTSFSIRHRI